MKIRKLYGMILFIAILGLGFAPMAGAQVNITVTAPAQVAAGAQFDVTVGVDTTVYLNTVPDPDVNVYLSGAALGIDYDPAVLEVVGTFGAADGDQNIASDLFNFNNSKVVDSRTTPGTPTEAWPRIGNNDTTGGILYLSGANAGYDAGTPWPFTAGTAKAIFKVKFMVKAGVAADTVATLTLIQTVPPADTNTGWDGTAAVHPLVGTNENWAATADIGDDFFDIPFNQTAFETPASITVTAGGPPPVEFQQTYQAGLNLVPFTASGTGITMASQWDAAIVADNPGVTISQIFGWDPVNQGWTSAYVNLGGGITMGDFALLPGVSYYIETSGNASLTISGIDFAQLQLYQGLNLMAVPYSKRTEIVNASDLDAELVAQGFTVSQIFAWDPVTQGFASAYVNLGGGIVMGDFVIDHDSMGLFVEVTAGGDYRTY